MLLYWSRFKQYVSKDQFSKCGMIRGIGIWATDQCGRATLTDDMDQHTKNTQQWYIGDPCDKLHRDRDLPLCITITLDDLLDNRTYENLNIIRLHSWADIDHEYTVKQPSAGQCFCQQDWCTSKNQQLSRTVSFWLILLQNPLYQAKAPAWK